MYLFVFVLFFVCAIFGIHTAELNSSCVTPDGQTATCIFLADCPELDSIAKNRNRNQQMTRFLISSQCGEINRVPLVCCKSTKPEVTVAVTPATVNVVLPKVLRWDLLPSRNRCGKQLSSFHITGGDVAELEEFPWMALLEYRKYDVNRGYSCGGMLISSRYVLSAAHCIVGNITIEKGEVFRVRLGEYNTATARDCTHLSGCADPPIDIAVEERFAHEDYDPTSIHAYNDIGLLRLAENAPYTTFIRPICLPTLPTDRSSPGQRLYVAGWGITDPVKNTNSSVKMKVIVPVVEQEQCSRQFIQARAIINDHQICAGGEDKKETCKGDSGGPLMNTAQGDSNLWFVEGVLSYGVKCGTVAFPSVYTKVTPYLEWIVSKMRP